MKVSIWQLQFEVAKALIGLQSNTSNAIRETLLLLPARAQARAQKNYLNYLRVDSGDLRRSISGFSRGHAGRYVVGLSNKMPYAEWLHEGVRPHQRVSSRGNVFTHPGIRGRPFMRNPLEQEAARAIGDMLKAIKFKGGK